MLRTRILVGAVLVVLATAMLVFDQPFQPFFPFLLLCVLVLALVSCAELLQLLGPQRRMHPWFCLVALLAVFLANWPAHILPALTGWRLGSFALDDVKLDPWNNILAAFTGVVLAAFLVEMARYERPDGAAPRIALTIWIIAYLGLLPSFLIQMRWLKEMGETPGLVSRGVAALILTIFIPKIGDIGAFFTGLLFGRHQMTPVLSPKKTWEGFAGGMVAAVAGAVLLNRQWPALNGDGLAVGFGLTVGLAGVLGDLAESLVKRDCRQKDASQMVPGFGGVLDVVDSIIFAAPVAYCWFR
jgi:phosphatidate cytidylyltransferase